MFTRYILTLTTLMCIALSGATVQVQGQEGKVGSTAPAPKGAQASSATTQSSELEFSDPAFDRFFDQHMLAMAWLKQDASSLADVGLLLGEGERVLLRTRKNFESQKLLELAAYLAGDDEDHKTLERLAKAAELRGDKKLASLVKDSIKLMATPNADVHNIPLVAGADAAHFKAVHEATLRHLRVIAICGDKESVEALKKAIENMEELTKAQKEYIYKAAEDHSANLIRTNPELRSTINMLDRLGRSFSSVR